MTKNYNMDQNPYISLLCPKPGVVLDTRAQPTQGGAGRLHSLAGRPGFGDNEVTLLTRVMLNR
jgi:hypothetical protein